MFAVLVACIAQYLCAQRFAEWIFLFFFFFFEPIIQTSLVNWLRDREASIWKELEIAFLGVATFLLVVLLEGCYHGVWNPGRSYEWVAVGGWNQIVLSIYFGTYILRIPPAFGCVLSRTRSLADGSRQGCVSPPLDSAPQYEVRI